MKKKILITGGSGLFALNCALTARKNYSVILGINKRNIKLNNIESRYISLDNVDSFSETLKIIKPHTIIHAAGLTNVEQCESNPDLAYKINVELSDNVARVCSEHGIPLVHISTDHLFAGDKPLIGETLSTYPLNVYGRTKAEAENRVLERYPKALVIRTNFYGWGPSYRKSFSDTIIQSIREKKEIKLFQDVYYTPIFTETLTNVILELINLKAIGIYNVVGDERLSKYEFGLRLANYFKLDANLIKLASLNDLPDLVQRPFDMSLSNEKVCAKLGRKLGGVDEHIELLYKQEYLGFSKEIQNL